ncbi:AraC family transcriptional activator of mtrCDE [Silvimonas terrae]|uniref:AraC family transcriptional activator of mtrCDE n=1 Tax=Silvimonas terrae TaxID=300266 RepID=A0A840RFH2_9NEIS|nr:AraC family transcriptional regulator [Silvimonas terrae]MBB5190991.1 AraC family transcriptional activator of mtrCDE [Silvimonas terrae]
MDMLTHLIQLARPQAGLDIRCLLGGNYDLPHAAAPAGSAPFHVVLAGACRIETEGGTPILARAGDFILVRGAHRVRNITVSHAGGTDPIRMTHDGLLPLRRTGHGTPEVDLLCGHFDYVRGPNELLFKTLPDPLHVSLLENDGDDISGVLQSLVALMRKEAAAQRAGALAVVTALSQALFAMALRNHGEHHPGQASVLGLIADPRLSAAAQALLKDPGKAWTIETLGDLAMMSRATFARHFREKSGMTVWQFLTEVRMALASDLLRETRRSAADIGMQVGYQSEAAFGKAFRQHTGEMPGQYRRRLRQALVTLSANPTN